MILSRSSLLAGATLFALVLLPAAPVAAQQPRGYYTFRFGYNPGYYGSAHPLAPPSPKGGAAHAPLTFVAAVTPKKTTPVAYHAPASSSLDVGMRWAAPTVTYVAIRGPDGKVRRFALKNGPATIQVRRLTLHPGEQLVLNVAAVRPAK
jgi:hypothetical protein